MLLFPSVPFHSILVFSKLKIAIFFHFHCSFLPLLNLSKNKEWKEIAILKLLFPSTFLLVSKIAISFHSDCYFLLLRKKYYSLPLFIWYDRFECKYIYQKGFYSSQLGGDKYFWAQICDQYLLKRKLHERLKSYLLRKLSEQFKHRNDLAR